MVSGDGYLISLRESSSWYNLFQSSWTLNKVRQSYLCTGTLFGVVLCNLLVELYSIIWIKKVDVYFLKKKCKQEFHLLLQVLQVRIY